MIRFAPKLLPLALMLGLSGCSLFETPAPKAPEAPPTRSALSAKSIKPEAEQLHARARVLWGQTDNCADPEKAIAYLNSALELEPQYPDALFRRGLAFWQLGHPEEGFEDLTRAIQLAPSAELYAWRAQLLLTEGSLGGAQQDAERALQLDEETPRAHGVLGAIHLEKNAEAEACKEFSKAAKLGMERYLEKAKGSGLCK